MEIVALKKVKLNNPILIEGFPGIGLVGTIAASFIVDKLGMEKYGYIVSEKFPPISAVHNFEPLHPARIYFSKQHNAFVLFSEFIIPLNAVYKLSNEILKWSKKQGVSKIISLGGITIRGEQDEVFGIASTPELREELAKAGIKLIREGATTGINGVLLAECASRNYPAASLLAEAKPDYIDPKGAALVLQALAKVTNIKVDVSELIEQAEFIEQKIKEILGKAKEAHESYKKTGELGPMYA